MVVFASGVEKLPVKLSESLADFNTKGKYPYVLREGNALVVIQGAKTYKMYEIVTHTTK